MQAEHKSPTESIFRMSSQPLLTYRRGGILADLASAVFHPSSLSMSWWSPSYSMVLAHSCILSGVMPKISTSMSFWSPFPTPRNRLWEDRTMVANSFCYPLPGDATLQGWSEVGQRPSKRWHWRRSDQPWVLVANSDEYKRFCFSLYLFVVRTNQRCQQPLPGNGTTYLLQCCLLTCNNNSVRTP